MLNASRGTQNRNTRRIFGHLACAETAAIYADVFGREPVRVFVFEQLVENPDALERAPAGYTG